MFYHPLFKTVLARLEEPRYFIQVLLGPRQVGKTQLARQIMEALPVPSHYATADSPTPRDLIWLEQQWEIGRALCIKTKTNALLVLDEIQKLHQWSKLVKRLWDEDTAQKTPLKVLLLGSSSLLMQQGLTESLAGRFETTPMTQWGFNEMQILSRQLTTRNANLHRSFSPTTKIIGWSRRH